MRLETERARSRKLKSEGNRGDEKRRGWSIQTETFMPVVQTASVERVDDAASSGVQQEK